MGWKDGWCPCFTQVSIHAHGKRSRNSISSSFTSFIIFLIRARDCTTSTLHNLADFYVESVTVHRIKRNDYSCFHNRWPNWKTKLKWKHLWERGGPWCFGALHSLRILRRGRIGSANMHYVSFIIMHKRRFCRKNFEEPNSCWYPLTSIVRKEILWKSMGTINCLITSILQNIFVYVQHEKETYTDSYQHEGE